MQGIQAPRIADFGVLYPILLFALPNSVQVPSIPAAPETLLLFALFPIMWLADRAAGLGRVSSSFYDHKLQILGLSLLALSLLLWATKGQVRDIAKLATWGVTFLFGAYYASDVRRVRAFWIAWLAIATVAALVLLADPSKWGDKVVNIFAWEHRTTYAYFLAVPTIVLLFQVLSGPTAGQLCRAGGLLCILLPALILSRSRGAWLIVAIGVGVLLFLAGRSRKAWTYAISVSVLVLAAVATLETEVTLLIRSIYDWDIRSSSLYRFDIYFAGLTAVSDAGWWGTGPSSVGTVLSDHTVQSYEHLDEDKFATDSDIIWLLVEAGIIGAMGLIIVLLAYAHQLLSRRQTLARDNVHRFIAAIFFAFLAWIALDNVLMTPFGWFLLGSLWGGFVMMRRTTGNVDASS